jgi:hypothetical protein
MCDKCDLINDQISHYLRLSRRLTDQQTLDAITRLTQELDAQKLALHPKE